jgi:uncharacterized repeat protein (TIGR03987 family)
MLAAAIVCMCLALLFYSIGVWSEKLQRGLKGWHLAMFWAGLVFDTTGTTIMGKIAEGGFVLNFHGVTGLMAILLMIFHAVWATIVLVRRDEKSKLGFHRFSLVVWCIWLIPFQSGMIFAMV